MRLFGLASFVMRVTIILEKWERAKRNTEQDKQLTANGPHGLASPSKGGCHLSAIKIPATGKPSLDVKIYMYRDSFRFLILRKHTPPLFWKPHDVRCAQPCLFLEDVDDILIIYFHL